MLNKKMLLIYRFVCYLLTEPNAAVRTTITDILRNNILLLPQYYPPIEISLCMLKAASAKAVLNTGCHTFKGRRRQQSGILNFPGIK